MAGPRLVAASAGSTAAAFLCKTFGVGWGRYAGGADGVCLVGRVAAAFGCKMPAERVRSGRRHGSCCCPFD
ncbi:MAG: hypothetical protein M3444_14760 [Acidobacteriota bacterium]|nr:hypothetical protein [Acidobacteriota bacterium]MDQ5836799.1 hypothetical protein [Acidobacteriota bacterium]